jgi:energy-converting hydrogenase Eha subunit C
LAFFHIDYDLPRHKTRLLARPKLGRHLLRGTHIFYSTSLSTDLLLPSYLNLPPHLSAHKYFFVCTLTVAAWDTLVLSPRSWPLMKTKEWPVLKIVFQVLRYLMPVEFIIVAVAFFDTQFTLDMCNKFYLFEPICTMILVALCSAVHVIRIHDKSRPILARLGLLLIYLGVLLFLILFSSFFLHYPCIFFALFPLFP